MGEVKELGIAPICTDLFTFWPPGPLDRLKDSSPIWRGTVLESRVFSHSLASSTSWSDDPFVEANRRDQGVLTQSRVTRGPIIGTECAGQVS